MINVMQAFKLPNELKQSGEVGIEVEAEGQNLPRQRVKGWRCIEDGSLRGESREYVLEQPVPRANVLGFLEILKAAYAREGTIIQDSFRTSVHVHVNVQEMPIVQWYNYITLYLVFEEMLTEFCGPTRVGNLFCLRAQDAEYMLDMLQQSAVRKEWHRLVHDNLRYAALNIKATGTYGSLEFRSMRGTEDIHLINNWVNILLSLKDAATRYKDPREIVEDMSLCGPNGFFNKNLGKYPFLYRNRHAQSILDGARRIQDLAYCVDWGTWEKGFSKNVFDPVGGARIRPDGVDELDVPHVEFEEAEVAVPREHRIQENANGGLQWIVNNNAPQPVQMNLDDLMAQFRNPNAPDIRNRPAPRGQEQHRRNPIPAPINPFEDGDQDND